MYKTEQIALYTGKSAMMTIGENTRLGINDVSFNTLNNVYIYVCQPGKYLMTYMYRPYIILHFDTHILMTPPFQTQLYARRIVCNFVEHKELISDNICPYRRVLVSITQCVIETII